MRVAALLALLTIIMKLAGRAFSLLPYARCQKHYIRSKARFSGAVFGSTVPLPSGEFSSGSLRFSSESSNKQEEDSTTSLRLLVPTADDMEEIGVLLSVLTLVESSESAAGRSIFLEGHLGAGKTAFARGFLRAATGDWEMPVTSPTYLLSNTYQATAGKDSNKDLE